MFTLLNWVSVFLINVTLAIYFWLEKYTIRTNVNGMLKSNSMFKKDMVESE